MFNLKNDSILAAVAAAYTSQIFEDAEHPTQKADRLSASAKTPKEHKAAYAAHKAALAHHASLPVQSYRTHGWKKHHTDAMAKHAEAAGLKEDTESFLEALDPKADAGVWISDFVNSKDPRFDGKSADERKQQALAAWYAARKEAGIKEETEQEDDKKSDVGDGDGDADDFQTDTAKQDEDDDENENEGEQPEGPGAAEAGPEVTGGEGEKAFKAGHDANTKVEEAPYTNKADGSDKIVPAAKPAPSPTPAEKLPENVAETYIKMLIENSAADLSKKAADLSKEADSASKDAEGANNKSNHSVASDAHVAASNAHHAAAQAHPKGSAEAAEHKKKSDYHADKSEYHAGASDDASHDEEDND